MVKRSEIIFIPKLSGIFLILGFQSSVLYFLSELSVRFLGLLHLSQTFQSELSLTSVFNQVVVDNLSIYVKRSEIIFIPKLGGIFLILGFQYSMKRFTDLN